MHPKPRLFARPTLLAAFAALAILLAGLLPASTTTAATPQQADNPIGALYADALKEGGTLVVYSGGDEKNQLDALKGGFAQAFPGVNIDIQVDLSKYQDSRINRQLEQGNLEPDVALLQTLHDFDLWKAQGVLMNYKPVGWEHVYSNYKDPDGAYTGMVLISFTNAFGTRKVSEASAPRDAVDYLDPRWRDKIVLTYPNDDDAVLYQFYKIIQKYGWGYMDKLQRQRVRWVRGTATPATLISKNRESVTFTTSAPLMPAPNAKIQGVLPKTDSFLTWPQTAAIFKQAKHPAAAKLFMSFLLFNQVQQALGGWSVRDDVPLPAGLKPLSEYNTSPDDFRAFMRNRPLVEAFRLQIESFIGTPQGVSPLIDKL